MLNGKSVLVTGGTGSFGKIFIKTILSKFKDIKRVIVLSRDEFKQFEMSNLPEFKGDSRLRFFIGDVRDKDRLYRAFNNVDIVIHAAALKQVPSCEYNPFEAVKTNIFGAQNVIDAAIDCGVKKVIALSTDKACAPVNLYGATKLCSDKLFLAANVYSGSRDTKFSVVRYGNVLGSRGSVVPFFKDLASLGVSELPITDERMTRFWLKLDHAVEMVLTALDVMEGGELFVRKVPSMRVVDLAQAISPGVGFKNVGIRPGEKVHEVMIAKEDSALTYEFEDYFVAFSPMLADRLQKKYQGARLLAEDFEYSSDKNNDWLTIEKMKVLIDEIG